MGVSKERPARSESVDVWRFDLSMTAQASDPVVLIVNGDKQDIRFVIGQGSGEIGPGNNYQQTEQKHSHRVISSKKGKGIAQ
jgi:hypothetical protein